ncbi:hypothetical protein PVAP13_7KG280800 [Panicum virgatum]|uniref:Uncharacterized protein n=1 Tax=Panicum virgatum TaxID=38727 RepID=A0A8T0QJI1_PANVG|nr:hypothetical protein PVAP13_7KG280800 [Panicum virgatum]
MHHFSNLAFATITPPAVSPSTLLRRTLQVWAGNPRVRLAPSSLGAQIVVFDDVHAREDIIRCAPFFYHGHTISLEHFDETPNRFSFDHEAFVALSIEDFLIENWRREHIMHSVSPFGNPHFIDPIRLSGSDYSAVLIMVKVDSLFDIPHHIHFKNDDGSSSVGCVRIIHFKAADFDSDSDSDPEDHDALNFSSGSAGSVLSGPSCHTTPSQVPRPGGSCGFLPAPSASFRRRGWGSAAPVLGWPVVGVRAFYGWFEVTVSGLSGEGGTIRMPMLPLPASLDGLVAVDFVNATIDRLTGGVPCLRCGDRGLPTSTV